MEFLMQPIRRTTVMEEVNDNDLLTKPLHYPAFVEEPEELPAMVAASMEGQICAAVGGVATEMDVAPQASDQSIDQIDPKTPGWTRRVRIGPAAQGRMPCPGETGQGVHRPVHLQFSHTEPPPLLLPDDCL